MKEPGIDTLRLEGSERRHGHGRRGTDYTIRQDNAALQRARRRLRWIVALAPIVTAALTALAAYWGK